MKYIEMEGSAEELANVLADRQVANPASPERVSSNVPLTLKTLTLKSMNSSAREAEFKAEIENGANYNWGSDRLRKGVTKRLAKRFGMTKWAVASKICKMKKKGKASSPSWQAVTAPTRYKPYRPMGNEWTQEQICALKEHVDACDALSATGKASIGIRELRELRRILRHSQSSIYERIAKIRAEREPALPDELSRTEMHEATGVTGTMIRRTPKPQVQADQVRVAAFNRATTATPALSFPDLVGVTSSKELVESIFSYVVRRDGEVRFESEGTMFGVNKDVWKDFVKNVLLHSQEIARFFGVPNKFKMESRGRELLIKYG